MLVLTERLFALMLRPYIIGMLTRHPPEEAGIPTKEAGAAFDMNKPAFQR